MLFGNSLGKLHTNLIVLDIKSRFECDDLKSVPKHCKLPQYYHHGSKLIQYAEFDDFVNFF